MEWRNLQLGELVDYQNGLWSGKNGVLTRAKVIRVTEMKDNGTYDLSTAKELQVEAKKLATRRVIQNSVLLERSGGGENKPVGRVIIFGKDILKDIYSFSNFTTLLLPKADTVFPKYIFYFLYFFHLSGKTKQLQKAVTGIRNLEFKKYLEQEIPVPFKNGKPDLAEQRRIADKLDKVYGDIGKGLQSTEGSMNMAGKIFESRIEAIFENGRKSGWKEMKLSEIFNFYNGKAHEKHISSAGKYKVVNSKFIASSGLNYKTTDKQLFPLMRGDITMVMSDVPNGKALAKCFVVDKDGTYTLNQRICALRPRIQVDIRFFYRQLNRNRYFLDFDNSQRQTNLRKDDILQCPLLVPDLSKQKVIGDELGKLWSKSNELITRVQTQQKLFDLLYSSALNQSFQMQP